jgi:UDP-N-acetylmuramate dehydrogenase
MDIPNFKGKIKRNEPLSQHTSYAIGGPVDLLAYPADRDDLVLLLEEIRERNLDFFVLGGGTNLLVKDGGFRGVAVSLERMREIRIEREYHSVGGHYAVLHADAGASLASLLGFGVDKGLMGLEFAAGIPGTVGGAVCMNAGTAEGEMGDVVDAVTMISPEGEIVTVGGDQMEFGYRVSGVPKKHLVLSATVVLRHDDKEKIKQHIRRLMEQRRARQPWGQPNAGSVFMNPLDESAGRLIEAAGLKGRRVGDAQVSEKHANFIVNLGKATAADVIQLMEIVRKTVLEVHGVPLEPEIKIIGED